MVSLKSSVSFCMSLKWKSDLLVMFSNSLQAIREDVLQGQREGVGV